jgi:hypothetical protein
MRGMIKPLGVAYQPMLSICMSRGERAYFTFIPSRCRSRRSARGGRGRRGFLHKQSPLLGRRRTPVDPRTSPRCVMRYRHVRHSVDCFSDALIVPSPLVRFVLLTPVSRKSARTSPLWFALPRVRICTAVVPSR